MATRRGRSLMNFYAGDRAAARPPFGGRWQPKAEGWRKAEGGRRRGEGKGDSQKIRTSREIWCVTRDFTECLDYPNLVAVTFIPLHFTRMIDWLV